MKKIKFTNFEVSTNEIKFNANIEGQDAIDEIFFKFSEDVKINENYLAVALSCLCGKKFDEIYMDLNLDEKILNKLSKFTQSTIMPKSITYDSFKLNIENEKILLNFSGGMDSLAAYYILPKNSTELVSLDFIDFERELNFYKKFNSYKIKTNFRVLGYNMNTWRFMGIASLLYNQIFNAKFFAFGTILEALPLNANEVYSLNNEFITPPFDILNQKELKLIQGLTEVGTALIVCSNAPYLVNDSLISLAPPGSRKRFRKELIMKILIKKFKLDDIFIEYTSPLKEHLIYSWGDDFTNDFLTLYWLKNIEISEVNKITKDIPKEVIDFVNNHSLNFYEKFNTNYLMNIPLGFKQEILKNLNLSNVEPYNILDFNELKDVMLLLYKYHPEQY